MNEGQVIKTVFRILNYVQFKGCCIGPDFTDAFPGRCTYSFGPGLVVCTDVSAEFCDAMDAILQRSLIYPRKASPAQLEELKKRVSVPYPIGTESFLEDELEYTYLDFCYQMREKPKDPRLPSFQLN